MPTRLLGAVVQRAITPPETTKRAVGIAVMMWSARLILTPIPLSNIPCPCDRSDLLAYIEQDGLMLDPSPGRIRCHCTRPGDGLGDVHGALQERVARLMEIDCEARQFNESDAMVDLVVAEPYRGKRRTFLRAGWRCRAMVDRHAHTLRYQSIMASRLAVVRPRCCSLDDEVGIH